jgi:hypothetical protein|tara:strand:+ start:347 stop:1444 length:1098 start_codon:yes stop_codon:yes gene_type:complete
MHGFMGRTILAKESALNQSEKNSLKLNNFIFHIIIAKDNSPEYLDAVQLDSSQESFFRDRILDACEGTQYSFKDKENSNFFDNCSAIINGNDGDFVSESRKIASDFCKQHKGTMSDGVFIISKITISSSGKDINLIALLKVDHSKVYRYEQKKDKKGHIEAIITEITNSFVEHKSAVQKWAIIDPSEHFLWDILARERSSSSEIADYFEKFLEAQPRETPSKLTKKSVSTVYQWARNVDSSLMPEDTTPPDYRHRAIQYMHTHDEFDTESFVNSVVSDTNKERKEKARNLLREELTKVGISGQVFETKPGSVPFSKNKGTIKTAEDVTIQWPGKGNAIESGIEVKQLGKNDFVVTIKTTEVIYPE